MMNQLLPRNCSWKNLVKEQTERTHHLVTSHLHFLPTSTKYRATLRCETPIVTLNRLKLWKCFVWEWHSSKLSQWFYDIPGHVSEALALSVPTLKNITLFVEHMLYAKHMRKCKVYERHMQYKSQTLVTRVNVWKCEFMPIQTMV